jgi:hypothetical protein
LIELNHRLLEPNKRYLYTIEASEAESFSGVPEQRARKWPIKAQSAAIARAMASICNDERALLGVMSGHDRNTLRLSG